MDAFPLALSICLQPLGLQGKNITTCAGLLPFARRAGPFGVFCAEI